MNDLGNPAAAYVEAPAFSEDAIADRFSRTYGDRLRFVAKWAQWREWDGAAWHEDETIHAYDLARAICREEAAKLNSKKNDALRITSAKTVAAVVKLASADRRHAATVDQWDADLDLLNTPVGVIDIRTGDILPHKPDFYMTKCTAVRPTGACRLWNEVLKRATDGDEDVQTFLQRMAGYMLTGHTREHAMFFMYGTGANSKTVVINAVAGMLGDYHTAAPMETFTAASGERHPTELAMLRGARLVTSVETEEGRRWNESRIKTLTGGDRVSARFMRQDFFTFLPQFKLLIAGNHKPSLRSVDEAIRRRIHLIPFSVTIPAEERDKHLSDKLKDEWGGVLEWAIEGAVAWYEGGLRPPNRVVKATEEYLSAEDAVAQWLEDRCNVGISHKADLGTLFMSWCQWCEANGEQAGTNKRFAQRLEDRGFQRFRTGKARGFHGLCPAPVGDDTTWK